MADPSKPDTETRDAERDESEKRAGADRMPTPEEERAAEQNELDPEVAEHEREMAERGKNQQGEGRVV